MGLFEICSTSINIQGYFMTKGLGGIICIWVLDFACKHNMGFVFQIDFYNSSSIF